MKKLIFFFALLLAVGNATAQGGHYKGGRGSSHKGGHYKNASTNNHYRKKH